MKNMTSFPWQVLQINNILVTFSFLSIYTSKFQTWQFFHVKEKLARQIFLDKENLSTIPHLHEQFFLVKENLSRKNCSCKWGFSVSAYIPSFRMPSCKQHDRQIFVETTQMSSSTTIWCFRNSEWLRQDLIPRISPQRDWYNVFPRYFCSSNSNHFWAAWENSYIFIHT